jgi:hypothetical protein
VLTFRSYIFAITSGSTVNMRVACTPRSLNFVGLETVVDDLELYAASVFRLYPEHGGRMSLRNVGKFGHIRTV